MLLSMLLSCHTLPTPSAAESVDPFAVIAAEYQAEYRLAVSAQAPPGVWMLCRMPHVGSDIPYHADEVNTSITVYVNEAAWPAMLERGQRTFSPGSVIVKKKASGGLGVMRKPTEGGDWQYAYVSAAGKVEADQAAMAQCASCHRDGTVPESARSSAGPIILSAPRDAVFLSAIPEIDD